MPHEVPALGARATAIIEVPTLEDRQELATEGDVTVEWLVGSGNGLGPSALPEAAASRRIRTHLRREMGLARDPPRHRVLERVPHRKPVCRGRVGAGQDSAAKAGCVAPVGGALGHTSGSAAAAAATLSVGTFPHPSSLNPLRQSCSPHSSWPARR